METVWEDLVAVVLSYIIGYLTCTGKLARLSKVLGTFVTAADNPFTTNVKRDVRDTPAGSSGTLNAVLDVVSPQHRAAFEDPADATKTDAETSVMPGYTDTPRVERRKRILSAVLDVVPVVGAFRRSLKPGRV